MPGDEVVNVISLKGFRTKVSPQWLWAPGVLKDYRKYCHET